LSCHRGVSLGGFIDVSFLQRESDQKVNTICTPMKVLVCICESVKPPNGIAGTRYVSVGKIDSNKSKEGKRGPAHKAAR